MYQRIPWILLMGFFLGCVRTKDVPDELAQMKGQLALMSRQIAEQTKALDELKKAQAEQEMHWQAVLKASSDAMELMSHLPLHPPAETGHDLDAPHPDTTGTAAPNEAALDADIKKGVRCRDKKCEVDRSLLDKLLNYQPALSTSARFVPSFKDGKPRGFKVYAIRPGSIFASLGLQNADLILAINGLPMATPDQALAAYDKVKNASHLEFQVERRGESVTLDYQIK
jgi:general secretion pathway protein C